MLRRHSFCRKYARLLNLEPKLYFQVAEKKKYKGIFGRNIKEIYLWFNTDSKNAENIFGVSMQILVRNFRLKSEWDFVNNKIQLMLSILCSGIASDASNNESI